MSVNEFIANLEKKTKELQAQRAQDVMEVMTFAGMISANPVMESPEQCRELLEKTKKLCQTDAQLTWIHGLLLHANKEKAERPSFSLDFPLKKP